MHALLDKLKHRSLVAFPQVGVAWYPVADNKRDYFDHYACLAETDIADELNRFRVEFVARHTGGSVLDVGIGDGAFIRARSGDTRGVDVDPKAVDWLIANDLYEPALRPGATKAYHAMTFWDSMEHINQPESYLKRVEQWAFVSMPIYDSLENVEGSKHFKPSEHVWYFTRPGLVWFMREYGFECVEVDDSESRIGREGVLTFAFKRCA